MDELLNQASTFICLSNSILLFFPFSSIDKFAYQLNQIFIFAK